MTKPRFEPWTPEQDSIILALRKEGKTAAYIAMRLTGRTDKAVAARCANLAQRKQRDTTYAAVIPCLRCLGEFKSQDKRKYRFCKNCTQANKEEGAGIFVGLTRIHSPRMAAR